MNQATVHATHHAFGLFRGERDWARNLHMEVAQPRRLKQLFGCDRNFDSALRQLARSQILRGIKSRAGAERCQQQCDLVLEFVQVGHLGVVEVGWFKDEPLGNEAALAQTVEDDQVADEVTVWSVIEHGDP